MMGLVPLEVKGETPELSLCHARTQQEGSKPEEGPQQNPNMLAPKSPRNKFLLFKPVCGSFNGSKSDDYIGHKKAPLIFTNKNTSTILMYEQRNSQMKTARFKTSVSHFKLSKEETKT